MATLARVFHKHEAAGPGGIPARQAGAPLDACALRALPQEDVFFYCKKIDNSRLVREADPRSRSACWSAIGAAGLVLVLLTGVLAPSVANTLEGYKLESLRAEQRRLLNDRQVLELKEAELLRPDRLETLAKRQDLVTPTTEQVVHLEGKGDSAVAMVK